jgi:prepilin-type N-terminal cleavage/methylation domain-containing protein
VGGFTLVEVMITLAILAAGLLAMVVLQVRAQQDGSRGRHWTTGAMLARDQIEQIQRMPFSSADLVPVGWTTPPWLANTANPDLGPGEIALTVAQQSGTVTDMIYTVFYQVIADPGGNADLRYVDLEVTWNDPEIDNAGRTRTGLPTAAVSTLLVNNDR